MATTNNWQRSNFEMSTVTRKIATQKLEVSKNIASASKTESYYKLDSAVVLGTGTGTTRNEIPADSTHRS